MRTSFVPTVVSYGQREKYIEKNIICECRRSKKGEKAVGFESTLPHFLTNPKGKSAVRFIFIYSIFVLLSTDKKAKTISLKVFKKIDFKNLRQDTIKGTLKP